MLNKIANRSVAIFFVVITLLLTSFSPSQGASIWDLQPGGASATGYWGADFSEEKTSALDNVSLISSSAPRKNNEVPYGLFYCSAMSDPNCSKGFNIQARLLLPPCTSVGERMCIEGLTLGTSAITMENAVLDREVKSLTTPADLITGLPRGGAPSLWNAPTILHKGGTKSYGVTVRVIYRQNREVVGSAGKIDAPILLQSLQVNVFPVTPTTGKYYPTELFQEINADGLSMIGARPAGSDSDDLNNCAWSESGSCAKYADFADGTRVGLTLRIGSELTGWLYGRMKDVAVAVEPIDEKFNRIKIEADPVAAPEAIGFIKKDELKDNLKIADRIKTYRSATVGYNEMISAPGSDIFKYDSVGGNEGFEDFAAFEPILKTKSGIPAKWAISAGLTASGYQATTTNKCFADKTKLLGIVTTNALVYSADPPEFKDGFLNYKVAGLHHREDGKTLTRGTYDLAIRQSVARCLYGFNAAPIQSSISIINADGSEQTVATETVRQDAKREWLFLSANNFTFSAPTIRVKLTQEVVIEPTPTAAATAKPVATKKRTITCIKGKTSKKVTAVKPKCPTGFKKK